MRRSKRASLRTSGRLSPRLARHRCCGSSARWLAMTLPLRRPGQPYRRLVAPKITLDSNEEQPITGLRVWNGYQRSERHFWDSARPKTLVLTDEKAWKTTVALRDEQGFQDVSLPIAFKGKHLAIEVSATFAGRRSKDIVLSEVRLLDGRSISPARLMTGCFVRGSQRFLESRPLRERQIP